MGAPLVAGRGGGGGGRVSHAAGREGREGKGKGKGKGGMCVCAVCVSMIGPRIRSDRIGSDRIDWQQRALRCSLADIDRPIPLSNP
jgi:hypothetical protein